MVRKILTVTGSNHDAQAAPVSAPVDAPTGVESVTLTDAATGVPVPCQRDGALLTWIEPGLERRATRTYFATFSAETQNPLQRQGVKLTQAGDDRLDVRIGGELLTSYHYGPEWHRPYLHPVIGPHGDPVTRAYPMVEGVAGETSDHPHHRGVWVAHGAVNSVDNWSEGEGRGRTVHREFAVLEEGPRVRARHRRERLGQARRQWGGALGETGHEVLQRRPVPAR